MLQPTRITFAPPRLSLVVPAYNEAQRIAPTLSAIGAWRRLQSFEVELLVVDDGSSDDTVAVAERLSREVGGLRVLSGEPNRGKGYAVARGMREARGRVRLFLDADGSTPIEEAGRLLEAIRGGADVAIGSRRAPGAATGQKQPWYRRLWSLLANRVVQAGLLDGIHDTQCGFKAFSARAAASVFGRVRTSGWGFDLEALAVARRLGFSIAELPVRWSDDRRSRVRISDAWRITREFLRIRRAVLSGAYDKVTA